MFNSKNKFFSLNKFFNKNTKYHFKKLIILNKYDTHKTICLHYIIIYLFYISI